MKRNILWITVFVMWLAGSAMAAQYQYVRLGRLNATTNVRTAPAWGNNVIRAVKKGTVTWQWYFRLSPPGDRHNVTISGAHTVYVVLASPQAPMTKPWTEVLDYSCDWADGQTSAASAATQITQKLYSDSGFEYDTEDGDAHYPSAWSPFELTDFLDDFGTGNLVNCVDMGKAVVTFGNAVGCDMVLKSYHDINRRLNCIDPIGEDALPTNNCFSTPLIGDDCRGGGFDMHAFGWRDDSVYDATLEYDMDSDPDNVVGSNPGCGDTTTGHDFELPTNVEFDDTYLNNLLDDWPVDEGSPYLSGDRSFTVE